MLVRNQTILVLVDVQEKLLPVMHQSEKLLKNLEILVEGQQYLIFQLSG